MKVTVTPNGALQGGSQKVSLVISGAIPEAPLITASGLTRNPQNMNEYGITFSSDPGAYFTLETSTNLVDWTDTQIILAESVENSVILTSSDDRRFWRLRR